MLTAHARGRCASDRYYEIYTLCSSIMHQILSKQERAPDTHRHSPYFPSLHLVHHNSPAKNFLQLVRRSFLSLDLACCPSSSHLFAANPAPLLTLERRTFLSACGFSDDELPRQSAVVSVSRALRRESRKSREPFGEIRYYLPPTGRV